MLKTIIKNEMKVAFLRKFFALLGSLLWVGFSVFMIVLDVRDGDISGTIIEAIILLLLGLLFVKLSIEYILFNLICVPMLSPEYRSKDLGRMLKNETFAPVSSGYSLDSSDNKVVKESQNWIDIEGYLYNKALIAAVAKDTKEPRTLLISYIDGCTDMHTSKNPEKRDLAYDSLRKLGFKDISEYQLDPKFEDLDEMFFDIFDRAANEKMFYELTADGLSFWDMRKLWDDEIGRNK